MIFIYYYISTLYLLQDLPALYLQGGSIIPLGPPHEHTGKSKISDDLVLLVALDNHGTYTLFGGAFLYLMHLAK